MYFRSLERVFELSSFFYLFRFYFGQLRGKPDYIVGIVKSDNELVDR
jgi:hypothetical protein